MKDPQRQPSGGDRAGFTLIEILIALTLLALLLSSVGTRQLF